MERAPRALLHRVWQRPHARAALLVAPHAVLQGFQPDLTLTLTLTLIPTPTPTPTPTSTLTLTLTKVFSQTGEQKNLWNALKYSTAFPLVYAGYLRKTEAQQAQSAPARSRPRGRPLLRRPARIPRAGL